MASGTRVFNAGINSRRKPSPTRGRPGFMVAGCLLLHPAMWRCAGRCGARARFGPAVAVSFRLVHGTVFVGIYPVEYGFMMLEEFFLGDLAILVDIYHRHAASAFPRFCSTIFIGIYLVGICQHIPLVERLHGERAIGSRGDGYGTERSGKSRTYCEGNHGFLVAHRSSPEILDEYYVTIP